MGSFPSDDFSDFEMFYFFYDDFPLLHPFIDSPKHVDHVHRPWYNLATPKRESMHVNAHALLFEKDGPRF